LGFKSNFVNGFALGQKRFQLILRDTETGVEEARFDITIDLAFTNDF